jgi:hypothetical protein
MSEVGIPRVEVSLSQDPAIAATFVALRFPSRGQADRPSKIESVRKPLRDGFVFSPNKPDEGQRRRTNVYLFLNAPQGG